MKVLGINGGFNSVSNFRYRLPNIGHDAAAVLLFDGKVVAGSEEERFNRIKHTTCFPIQSMKFCLEFTHTSLEEINTIAYSFEENTLNNFFTKNWTARLEVPNVSEVKDEIVRIVDSEFNENISNRLVFMNHHKSHAASAFYSSGFEESLILIIDGAGDGVGTSLWKGKGLKLSPIAQFDTSQSIGFFYLQVIRFLGYRLFDEYKVMGLSAYGRPHIYRDIFNKFYKLIPKGRYELKLGHIHHELIKILKPRQQTKPLEQVHKDIAASLQEAIENIIIHILNYYQGYTMSENLCLAGGVAHNCRINGKILYSEKFKNIFVQPASHDAGTALGAALLAYYKYNNTHFPQKKLINVYWGNDVSDANLIQKSILPWSDFISFNKMQAKEEKVSVLLNQGNIVGWVQGRSEFGPRALGARSILADPRPLRIKNKINKSIKNREQFRPFAPIVMEEYVNDYYELPNYNRSFPFMSFTLKARPEIKQLLESVTHIDDTARIQTVSKSDNTLIWELIRAFKKITGIPILLNTSFNNNVEPIVNTINDAIVCFLTTDLDYLIVGDYLISKKFKKSINDYYALYPSLPPYVRLCSIHLNKNENFISSYRIEKNYSSSIYINISKDLFDLLKLCEGKKSLKSLINVSSFKNLNDSNRETELIEEILELWAQRYIILTPKRDSYE